MKSSGNRVFLPFRLLHPFCKNTNFQVNRFTRYFLYTLLIVGDLFILFFPAGNQLAYYGNKLHINIPIFPDKKKFVPFNSKYNQKSMSSKGLFILKYLFFYLPVYPVGIIKVRVLSELGISAHLLFLFLLTFLNRTLFCSEDS